MFEGCDPEEEGSRNEPNMLEVGLKILEILISTPGHISKIERILNKIGGLTCITEVYKCVPHEWIQFQRFTVGLNCCFDIIIPLI